MNEPQTFSQITEGREIVAVLECNGQLVIATKHSLWGISEGNRLYEMKFTQGELH